MTFSRILAVTASMIVLSGCAGLSGTLRRDFDDIQYDDGPVTGGRMSERGYLADEAYRMAEDEAEGEWNPPEGTVGHADRRVASLNEDRNEEASESEESNFNSSEGDRPPAIKRKYRNGARATRADFVDDANQNESSLWASDGQTNYYFTKNKIRGVGDLVSVTIEDPLLKDIGREILRNLTQPEREFELARAQERLQRKAMGLPEDELPEGQRTDKVAQSAAAPERAPAGADASAKNPADIKVPEATPADVNVLKSLDIKSGEPIMAEIVERYPNGNYRVRAVKRIPYKGGRARMLSFVAIAKGSDISEDDVITSGKLYEYRVEEMVE